MTDIRAQEVPIGVEADTIGHSPLTICRWKLKTGFCSNCMLNEPQLCYLCYFELVCWIKNIYVWNHWQVTEIKCVISTFFPLVPNLFAWFLFCSSSTSFRLFGLCFRSYPTALKKRYFEQRCWQNWRRPKTYFHEMNIEFDILTHRE